MKTIKDIAQEIYPVEEKAECHTAFLQGAEHGNKQAIQYVTDLLVSAFEHGFLSEKEINKVFKAMKSEINN